MLKNHECQAEYLVFLDSLKLTNEEKVPYNSQTCFGVPSGSTETLNFSAFSKLNP